MRTNLLSLWMNMMMVLKCEKLNLRVLRNIVFKRDCNSQLLRKAKYSHRSENTSENAINKLGKSHFTHLCVNCVLFRISISSCSQHQSRQFKAK